MAENNFKEIESKWQEFWATSAKATAAKDDSTKPKKYVLVEFPYPSGTGLHVGHAFSFTGGDVYARYMRMKGHNVMFPMGWDAFGLPTENYAVKTKRKPQEVTKENTDMFRSQMKRLAFSFDWSREVNTTDPNYYKWTQWIFIQLFKKGLAYKQEMPINWCPECKIGLANEEVLQSRMGGNVCERCGAGVERRTISQWVVKITDYADRLIEGLKETDFVDKVKAAQINWIGRKDGINIDFQVKDTDQKLTVFTTTPVNFGATFLVVAPEHALVGQILDDRFQISEEKKKQIQEYVKQSRSKSDLERSELQKEKTGVFSGLYAINHVNGKEIPIWITDFVLANYGTGAVQGCPGHDQRDWDFAKKFGISIPQVVDIPGEHIDVEKECFPIHTGEEGVMVNSDFLNGIDFTEAMKKTMDYFEEKGWGKRVVSYHLRDWIFSRQHYWGEPIPMIFCEACAENQIQNSEFKIQNEEEKNNAIKNAGWMPVPEEDLPIKLPEVEAYEPTDSGESPLANIPEWVKTTCPVCGGEAKRETDTMPNWAGSDWYFLAYCFADKINNGLDCHDSTVVESRNDVKANDTFVDIFRYSESELRKWLPVDVYIGGDEHNTLHLLYSRFIYQFLNDIGAVPKEIREPYYKRMSHGVILGPDNQRMSKSKGNVIVPEVIADKYGVDVVRMYLMFMGPFTGTMAWNEKTLMGVKRFLDKFKTFIEKQIQLSPKDTVKITAIHKTIKGVGEDIEQFGYNTAIAKMMELLNELSARTENVGRDNVIALIKLLAPFAPYTTEELWSQIRQDGDAVSVHTMAWPEYEDKYLIDEMIMIAVAVNGKVRSEIEVDSNLRDNQQQVLEIARSSDKVKGWLEGKEILREVYVPGRMINFVVK